ATDDLYRKLLKLRDGDPDREYADKPLIASFAGIAASGGYYAAMPASRIFAEETTLTGSIGVYASFPNVHELAEKNGVFMHTLKAGDIKATGSMFRKMTTEDRIVLQEMVDDAYDRFLTVVSTGRPKLTRKKLRERFTVTPFRPDPQAK